MSKRLTTFTLAIVALLTLSSIVSAQNNLAAKSLQPQPVGTEVESDRLRDGLTGPVRRVRTEIVKLLVVDGKFTEGKRSLLEVVSYDINGKKTDNQYFPQAGGTLTGKEVYQYDDKGNISEMTTLNDDGTLLSKEVYRYTFDFAGNWNRMTTSVAVVDKGSVVFEPTEVTYRSIMYYLDENTFKMVQAGVPGAEPTEPALVKTGSPNKPQDFPANNPKLASALPTPTVATDELNTASSVEVKNAPLSASLNISVGVLSAEPPPPPSPKPLLKPVSGGVLNGTAINLPTPVYPDSARRMRAAGLVSVEVVVDETGKVISATAVSGPAVLRAASVLAAMKARFSPTKLSGQPVKVTGVINYKFSLAQ